MHVVLLDLIKNACTSSRAWSMNDLQKLDDPLNTFKNGSFELVNGVLLGVFNIFTGRDEPGRERALMYQCMDTI